MITAPILLLAGLVDQLAPPSVMLHLYHSLGSKEKTLKIFSQANGYHADYGHVDLVLGKFAVLDVFPLVTQWLIKQDQKLRRTDQ